MIARYLITWLAFSFSTAGLHDMKPDDNKALIHRPGTAISPVTGRGTNPVIARVTEDALARARSARKELSHARFRIGEYELREPDYRQILDWAENVGMEPEEVLDVLQASFLEPAPYDEFEKIGFQIIDGSIRCLIWDLDQLGLLPSKWHDKLLIETLGVTGTWPIGTIAFQPRLSSLRRLFCLRIDLEILNLSFVTSLTELNCRGNKLSVVDLSPVPELKILYCSANRIKELDLSPTPKLSLLYCGINQLRDLNLDSIPELTVLAVGGNYLSQLDLSHVPNLSKLYCGVNDLNKLDLVRTPKLKSLYCGELHFTEKEISLKGNLRLILGGNRITELDLSVVPLLTALNCWGNKLTELNIDSLPFLTELSCGGNEFTKLKLSFMPKLKKICCSFSLLRELDLSQVPCLEELDCQITKITELDLSPVPKLKKLECEESVRIINPPSSVKIGHLTP